MKDGESLRDIVRELMDRSRLGEHQRREYDERIAKAVWRDRAEVLDIIAERDARKEDEAVQEILEAVRDMSRQEAMEIAAGDPANWIGGSE